MVFEKCDFSTCTNERAIFARRSGLVSIIGLDDSKHDNNTSVQEMFLGVPCTFEKFNWQNVFCSQSINISSAFYGAIRVYQVDFRKCKPILMNYTFAEINSIKKIGFPFVKNSTIIKNVSLNAAINEIECEPMSIYGNIVVSQCNALFESAILNLINAAAANVTYTLHPTVYAKCASGGEWHTDIQAAIDAKAAQGFTVTLISA